MRGCLIDAFVLTCLAVLLTAIIYWATGCAGPREVSTIDAGPRVLPVRLDGFQYITVHSDIWTQC